MRHFGLVLPLSLTISCAAILGLDEALPSGSVFGADASSDAGSSPDSPSDGDASDGRDTGASTCEPEDVSALPNAQSLVFVSPISMSTNRPGNGTRGDPYHSIQTAVATAKGAPTVVVCTNSPSESTDAEYTESLSLNRDATILGGYDCKTWRRKCRPSSGDPAPGTLPKIKPTKAGATVVVNSAVVRLDGLELIGVNNTPALVVEPQATVTVMYSRVLGANNSNMKTEADTKALGIRTSGTLTLRQSYVSGGTGESPEIPGLSSPPSVVTGIQLVKGMLTLQNSVVHSGKGACSDPLKNCRSATAILVESGNAAIEKNSTVVLDETSFEGTATLVRNAAAIQVNATAKLTLNESVVRLEEPTMTLDKNAACYGVLVGEGGSATVTRSRMKALRSSNRSGGPDLYGAVVNGTFRMENSVLGLSGGDQIRGVEVAGGNASLTLVHNTVLVDSAADGIALVLSGATPVTVTNNVFATGLNGRSFSGPCTNVTHNALVGPVEGSNCSLEASNRAVTAWSDAFKPSFNSADLFDKILDVSVLPKTESVCRGGTPSDDVKNDILGLPRDMRAPSIGAWEVADVACQP
jgi:hypothetical protein